MSMDIEQQVKKTISERLRVDENKIDLDSKFADDFAADSLDLVELMMAFEEEFGCEIPDDKAEQITTVRDVVKYIKEHKEA